MAWKLLINRGQKAENVTRSAGTAIAGGDGIELNIDQAKMGRAEALVLVDELKRRIQQSPWPEA